MATTQAMPQGNKIPPAVQNQLNRQAVLSSSVEMFQPIQTATFNPAQNNPFTFTLRNVGLLRSILVTLTATIANNDGALDLTLTDFGLANLVKQFLFTDLNNNQRIIASGWYISWLNSIKHRGPYASGFALETDTMGGYGENFSVLNAPTTIAHGTSATVRAVFEIPISYSDDDLRGAMLLNVVNATSTLQMTINQAPFSAAGADSTFAVYKGTTTAVITSCTATFYQNYLDQLPRDSTGNIIVPLIDLSTVYELKTTNVNGMTANNEFGFPYPNFRDILSTIAIYNHDTTVDTGRVGGTDISYWSLQAANFTNLWKKGPLEVALHTRQILRCDFPKGGYFFSSRRKPINSIQYGNMELILNPSLTTGNSNLYVGLEMFNLPNTVVNSGSIASA
jgi:hypothetical protein